MAKYLYRLGAWAFERRRIVAAAWTFALAAVIAAAVGFGGTTNDKFTVPGTESQEAQELLEERYPAASGTYARNHGAVRLSITGTRRPREGLSAEQRTAERGAQRGDLGDRGADVGAAGHLGLARQVVEVAAVPVQAGEGCGGALSAERQQLGVELVGSHGSQSPLAPRSVTSGITPDPTPWFARATLNVA